MRIARGPIGLRYTVVLLTLPGLAACGVIGGDDATTSRPAAVALESSSSPTSGAPTPSPSTTGPTEKVSPTKKKKKKKKKKKTKKPTSAPTTKPDPGATNKPKPKPSNTKTNTKPPGNGGGGSNSNDVENEVRRLVNVERKKAGCNPLAEDGVLVKVARAHSKDMAEKGYFSHTSPDGRSPFDRMSDAGYKYSYAAENIAAGQGTPEAVMTSWMNSPGHRANILNCNLTEIGVGVWKDSGSTYGIYWTQNFGTPR